LNRNKALAFYKRAVYIINPSFQITFSLIVCSFIVISSVIYPIILIDFLNELASRYPEIATNMKLAQSDLILYMGLIQLFVIVLVFIIFIFFTHRIAGPMHKLKMHLSKIRQGEPITPLTFRSGDHFHDVAEEVTLFLETLTYNQENDFMYLDEISTYIENLTPVVPDDKKPVLSEISRRLLEIKSRYKNSP
jgi:nitrogen fixation/metabolism regulation signal transduction histidine kinase